MLKICFAINSNLTLPANIAFFWTDFCKVTQTLSQYLLNKKTCEPATKRDRRRGNVFVAEPATCLRLTSLALPVHIEREMLMRTHRSLFVQQCKTHIKQRYTSLYYLIGQGNIEQFHAFDWELLHPKARETQVLFKRPCNAKQSTFVWQWTTPWLAVMVVWKTYLLLEIGFLEKQVGLGF